jgi:chemotaxis protein MotA
MGRCMDRASILGLILGGLALFGGHYLEGGSAGMILQATAMVIVLGGTAGAVCLSFSGRELRRAWGELPHIFRPPADDLQKILTRVMELAYRSRREGFLALEKDVAKLPDPFLRRALQMIVDGYNPQQIRDIMEMELVRQDETGQIPARVFEAAGGYAPTIGILGAVLGLIQVMQHISEPSRLGTGVAVAFVATIYGVALANLLFLPMAHKLRLRQQQQVLRQEMLLEAVIALAQGDHPRLVAERLQALMPGPLEVPPAPPTSRVRPLPGRGRYQPKTHATPSGPPH